MNTLRARLALLLVVAIVSVVALASLVAISVTGFPTLNHIFDETAAQIVAIAAQAEEEAATGVSGANRWYSLRPDPLPEDPVLTQSLRAALRSIGSTLDATVAAGPPTRGMLISVPIGHNGWTTITIARPAPPKGGLLGLISWMALIVVGAITVALMAADRMTRPLRLLENAVASVGSDGVLPALPESGSAEVRATARAMNRLSSRLKTAMASRMRLVAAAGHDLRTPLTRMRLRAEFVEDKEERAAWQKDLDELDHIADSAIGLVREEVESTPAEPLRVDQLVKDMVEDLAAVGLPVCAGSIETVWVRAGALSLTRALQNLATNAATHGGGGRVSVSRAGGKAIVTIVDSGDGIPSALLERVFEPFFQVDPARRRNFRGAGLGLAIAKEIIDRSGGTISLENRPEGGLRQIVVLPEVQQLG